MKILCTADIHIKLGQKNVPRDWAMKRYDMFLDQLDKAEDDADLVIIPGDIFDRMPTLDELAVYFQLVARRKKPTKVSTGNHEATKKGKSFFKELKGVTERLNPLVEVVVDYIYEDETSGFYIVPYEFIKKRDTWDSLNEAVVFTHVRGEIPPHVKPEIPLEWLEKFPVVFAGDLHSHSNTQRNIVYPGSPMTTSFHRGEVDTGYLMIDTRDWSWDWRKFDLPQLIRKTVADPDEMLATDFHHTIYELEGSIRDLSKVENSDLLDKKLVKRSSDTALILNKNMTISDELVEYLRYIQELPEDQITKVMEVFHEYGSTSITSME